MSTVFARLSRPAPLTTATPVVQRTCACQGSNHACDECKKKDKLQRTKAGYGAPAVAPSLVHQVLRSLGEPLDARARAFFLPRFGHDFTSVRIHTDPLATASADAVHARAYTVGQHIVFARGTYNSRSADGLRLLAHELTHVTQQRDDYMPGHIAIGPPDDAHERSAESAAERLAPPTPSGPIPSGALSLQRDEKKGSAPAEQKSGRIDVALLFDDDARSQTEAQAYAPTVVRATSTTDAKKKLVALGVPIGTVFVVSHSNRAGEIEIISEIGTISWVKISDLGKDLQGGLPAEKAPTTFDFRGCKVGEAPGEIETFRKQTGAGAVKGTNCWSIVATATPLTINGTDITAENQIPKGMEAKFDKLLRQQLNNLKSDDGRRVKDCLIGLGLGETADKSFDKIKRLYFQHHGALAASWASPEFNNNWQEGSICSKDMTASSKPCKSVTKVAPAAGGKQGALFIKQPDTAIAADLSEPLREDVGA